MSDWQPIETAPKDHEIEGGTFGPTILLASTSGHRAIGYWGKGRRNASYGWVNPHDHLVMDYWNAFTHWLPLPQPPEDAR